jgi:hypothetical protein
LNQDYSLLISLAGGHLPHAHEAKIDEYQKQACPKQQNFAWTVFFFKNSIHSLYFCRLPDFV